MAGGKADNTWLYRLPTTNMSTEGNARISRGTSSAPMEVIGKYTASDTVTYYLVRTGRPQRSGKNLMYVEKSKVNLYGTQAEERKRNNKMRADAASLIAGIDWENMTNPQRMNAIKNSTGNDLFSKMQALLGTNVADVVFSSTLGGWGEYRSDENKIYLSSKSENLENSEFIKTALHEFRHAYQWETLINPSKHYISRETHKAWSENWPNQTPPPAANDPNYDAKRRAYISQPIEWDACKFAGFDTDIAQFGRSPVYSGNW